MRRPDRHLSKVVGYTGFDNTLLETNGMDWDDVRRELSWGQSALNIAIEQELFIAMFNRGSR